MSVHPRDVARPADIIEEAGETPDPMPGFADEAGNRLDQDLKLLKWPSHLSSAAATETIQRLHRGRCNNTPGIRPEIQAANLSSVGGAPALR